MKKDNPYRLAILLAVLGVLFFVVGAANHQDDSDLGSGIIGVVLFIAAAINYTVVRASGAVRNKLNIKSKPKDKDHVTWGVWVFLAILIIYFVLIELNN